MGQRIEIPLSKRKIILFLIGSIMFVVAGILGIIMPERFNSIYKSPEFIRITSILGVIFFGLAMVFTFKKLIGNNKFGLVIDEYGITDYSTATSIGLIEWSDIKAIEKINFASKNDTNCSITAVWVGRDSVALISLIRPINKFGGMPAWPTVTTRSCTCNTASGGT